MTRFENEQNEIKKHIKEHERMNLEEKSWKMMGEITVKDRDPGVLLEEQLSFQYGKISVPIITDEVTKKIELIIQQRIKDQVFDDVERKRKHEEDVAIYRLPAVISSEKSKDSLATIYEKEYLDKIQGKKVDLEGNETHDMISKMLSDIFIKLDTLTNLNYIPKMPKIDVEIKTNYPTILMEDPAPLAMQTTTNFAPEEIYEKDLKNLVNKSELTKNEKKNAHKIKKTKLSKKKKLERLIEKRKEKLGKISSKKAAINKIKNMKSNKIKVDESSYNKKTTNKGFTSSSGFFKKLQSISQE